jgi:hypothetical protein
METTTGFRITLAWLDKEGACQPARDLLGDHTYTVRRAFALALDAGRPDWCDWAALKMLDSMRFHAVCGFAARRARSVQHLWSERWREQCERVVCCAERIAAGEVVPRCELFAAAEAVEKSWEVRPSDSEAAYTADIAVTLVATAVEAAARSSPEEVAAAASGAAVWAVWALRGEALAKATPGTSAGSTAECRGWLDIADDLQEMLSA